jgi:uncharacterized membrane-anchored protein
MNRTQKEAWAVMIISTSLLLFILSMALVIALFLAKSEKVFPLNILPLTFLGLSFVAMGSSLIFLRRKQSPAEVDYDERDVAIKRKAALVSHITLWILIFLGCTIPFAITDQRGTFPVSALPIALFIISITDLLVYSLTILIQYGRSGDGDK